MSNISQPQGIATQINSDCYRCKVCDAPATVCITLDWVKRPVDPMEGEFGEPEVAADGPDLEPAKFFCQEHYEKWLG
jgi:hypothetical protein